MDQRQPYVIRTDNTVQDSPPLFDVVDISRELESATQKRCMPVSLGWEHRPHKKTGVGEDKDAQTRLQKYQR